MHFLDDFGDDVESPTGPSNEEVNKIEKLFLQKLTEKYRLTDRDMKKAFGQFDSDGSGLLETPEIVAAVKGYLNGVADDKVRALCARFDPTGRGKVAYHEFVKYLMALGEGKVYKPQPPQGKATSQSVGKGKATQSVVGARKAEGLSRPGPSGAGWVAQRHSQHDPEPSPLGPEAGSPIRRAYQQQEKYEDIALTEVSEEFEAVSIAGYSQHSYSVMDDLSSIDVKIKLFIKGLASLLLTKAKAIKGTVSMKERLSMHAKVLLSLPPSQAM